MSDLNNKLAQRAQGGAPASAANPGGAGATAKTIHDYLQKMGPEIARALPKHMDADRLAQVALTTIRLKPQLMQCSTASLMAAVMQSAQLGLEPGALGHSYFVPFRNSKTGGMDVQFIVGYKGLLDLMWRAGKLASVSVREVCEGDEFRFEYGLNETLVHKPALEGRGKAYAYYGVARMKDGGVYMLVMSREDIDYFRSRSKAGSHGPWVTDYDAMARKTVLRRMATWLPMSIEVATALAVDTDGGQPSPMEGDITEVLDITAPVSEENPASDTPPTDPGDPAKTGGGNEPPSQDGLPL